ncbi:MAG: hypothetical protein Q4C81_08235 [Kocuria sp.]|nr:hypothetical protein [Kocuria sp.]
MVKKLAIVLLALVLAAPLLSMVGIGLLMNPALTSTCTVPSSNPYASGMPT